MSEFQFTFGNIKQQYKTAIESGYSIITCNDYFELKRKCSIPSKCIVNRIDIDLSVKKAETLGQIFKNLGIKGTFFIRLHAAEYNPFSFENYRIIKELIENGNEIGYHSEVVDESTIWKEDSETCLKRDIDVINKMFNINIKGIASHGGLTGYNNLDFWKSRKVSDFGLNYEAYDKDPGFNLFNNSFYISDSEWTRWKCYDNGKLINGDNSTFGEHLKNNHKLIYLLIHSDTYFNRHFYE
jgi:hypothetical protein